MGQSIDGIYAAYFSGAVDSGIGLFHLASGIAAGADVGGVTYDGTYDLDEVKNALHLVLRVKLPPNGVAVQGHSVGPLGMEFDLNFSYPLQLIGQGYVPLDTPLGPVNASLKKLRSLNG